MFPDVLLPLPRAEGRRALPLLLVPKGLPAAGVLRPTKPHPELGGFWASRACFGGAA